MMLDWCFTFDLLNSSAMSGVGRGLRATQSTFTQPWLVLALALASMLATYNGLVRRRVAETLGEALLMVAMMAGGLWVIMDPSGTVGALGEWANDASLGTLAAVAAGTPDIPRGRSPKAPEPVRDRGRTDPGATWSSATSAGAPTPRASTRDCARPR